MNTSLILFLDAVTSLIPHLDVTWTIQHLSFTSKLDSKFDRKFEARTDGAMMKQTGNGVAIRGLVEVKNVQHHDKPDTSISVGKQEASEMVGWVKNTKGNEAIFKEQ